MSEQFVPGGEVAGRLRYSNVPFPPYSYVSGVHPHPVSDPRGHAYGHEPERPAPFAADRWRENSTYLYGFDLFNHGYYWEAHEAWESLWHAAGRDGATADFLKGLIKLAAAGVKFREGNAAGVERHARRSLELLPTASVFAGARLEDLRGRIGKLADTAPLNAVSEALLPIVLELKWKP